MQFAAGQSKSACESTGISVPIGAGMPRNSKIKSFQKVTVKSLQWSLSGIISCHIYSVQ